MRYKQSIRGESETTTGVKKNDNLNNACVGRPNVNISRKEVIGEYEKSPKRISRNNNNKLMVFHKMEVCKIGQKFNRSRRKCWE